MKKAVFGSAIGLVWCVAAASAQQQPAPTPEAVPAHKVFVLTGCLTADGDTKGFKLTDASAIGQVPPQRRRSRCRWHVRAEGHVRAAARNRCERGRCGCRRSEGACRPTRGGDGAADRRTRGVGTECCELSKPSGQADRTCARAVLGHGDQARDRHVLVTRMGAETLRP